MKKLSKEQLDNIRGQITDVHNVSGLLFRAFYAPISLNGGYGEVHVTESKRPGLHGYDYWYSAYIIEGNADGDIANISNAKELFDLVFERKRKGAEPKELNLEKVL